MGTRSWRVLLARLEATQRCGGGSGVPRRWLSTTTDKEEDDHEERRSAHGDPGGALWRDAARRLWRAEAGAGTRPRRGADGRTGAADRGGRFGAGDDGSGREL